MSWERGSHDTSSISNTNGGSQFQETLASLETAFSSPSFFRFAIRTSRVATPRRGALP